MLISLQGEYWKIFALGTGLENLGSRDRIGQYYSASRDGHQIHPRRLTQIDSVKINPSLVMMRECKLHASNQHITTFHNAMCCRMGY